ncbi:hypothetical protein ACHQM5_015735 [Ranunculus cassubicifolius]
MASDEEMDSLFEGMELFNPSSSDPPPTIDPLPSPPLSVPLEQQPLEIETSTSTPLDENLFSDLTLIDSPISPRDTQQPPPPSTTPVSTSTPERSITRQVSRKKKKSSLRIGYGRDNSNHDLTELPDTPVTIPESEVESKVNFDEIKVPVTVIENEENNDFEDTVFEGLDSMQVMEEGENGVNVNGDDHVSISSHGVDDDVTTSTSTSGYSNEQKLEEIRGRIAEKLEGIREMAVSVSATRKELARKRRKAVENVNLASFKYKELERELEEACETEDFEKAERVSDSLAAVEKEKEDFFAELRSAEADCDAFELRMQEVLELQIAAEEEGVALLEQFAKDAAGDADVVMKNAEEISSKETAEWVSSIELLEVKKMELEIESHLINDARSGLNDSIEHLIEDDRREQEILYKKQGLLKDELQKLLLLVRQKEAEIVENDSNIQEVEKRITGALSEFQEMQSNIDTKYYDMQTVISKMDSESETLSQKKKEIDDFLSQEEKRGQELKKLADVSMDEARACQELVALRKSLAMPILKYREVKLRLGKTEANILEDVQTLKQDVSAARTSLQELSSSKSSIQQEITSAKQRIFFIDKRSPELEAEKRVAASARNFKEAGRIASEVKTLTLEKETLQTKLESDSSQLGKIDEEINNTIENLNNKEELILVKEKEAAMSGCERLRLVYATAMAERSAALELGDVEEAESLNLEAEAADLEASRLKEAYDFKEEEFESAGKELVSVALIANLGRSRLAEMAKSLVTG